MSAGKPLTTEARGVVQDRREFLRRAAAGIAAGATVGGATGLRAVAAPSRRRAAGEKLRIAVIGVANRGGANLDGVAGEEIVALADIDAQNLAPAAKRFPKAKTYADGRKLLDEVRELDAVVVSTPDHTHAVHAARALSRGLHVYCEKPLAYDLFEVRTLRRLAAEKKCVTQMGTQIHAGANYRRVVEIVQAGVLGPIERVQVWVNSGTRPGRRVDAGTAPGHVDYDLWTGPAPMRPYDGSHFHFNWRYWYDFGGGVLSDFGCHYMDLPFWALGLTAPTSVVARGEKTYAGDNDVPDNMQVEYRFPAAAGRPAVQLTWYHGSWRPAGAEAYRKGSAVLFEGAKGRLLADYGSRKLFLEPGVEEPSVAESIPNSIGHHAEWIEACKAGGATTCNFDYAGNLTENVLLGNVSYRLGGKELQWDAAGLRVTNEAAAEPLVKRAYREGWTLT